MSLTLGTGPFARPPVGRLNADLWAVAPDRALYLHPLDRRIRGELAGEVVVDSTRGRMLHETGLMPRWYLPYEDVREDLLVPSGTLTHCPYKGDASYWSVRVGDRVAEDALWTYAEPIPGAPPLAGLVSFYLGRLDAWYEEDEKLIARPRDPFHRVDTRRSSRHVVVRVGDVVVAESRRPVAVLETGVGARWYLPPDDVRRSCSSRARRRAVARTRDWPPTSTSPPTGHASTTPRGATGNLCPRRSRWPATGASAARAWRSSSTGSRSEAGSTCPVYRGHASGRPWSCTASTSPRPPAPTTPSGASCTPPDTSSSS